MLILTLDTLRADHLGTYGYFRDTSPVIDRLADESIVFERCLTPMATTLPAHMTLFTGTYPLEHGILSNFKHGGMPFDGSSALRSFPQAARDLGYRTAAFVSATPVKRVTGIDAGFETFDEPEPLERPAEETVDAAIAWLRRNRAEPFVLWVHLFDPHRPYAPPAPFDDLYRRDAALETHLEERRFAARGVYPDGDELDPLDAVNRYDGEVSYVDGQVGRLLEALGELALEERTIVLLVGDHGEGLGQHGEAGHGNVHHEQIHVPLLLRVPGREARRVERPVALADVLPTALSLAGVAEAFGPFLALASGADALRDGAAAEPVFSQRTGRQRPELGGPAYVLTSGDWKYVHEPPSPDRLFDLRQDPFELHDVADRHPDRVARFEALLQEALATQKARAEILSSDRVPGEEALPEEHLEALRSLGYVK